MAVGVDPAQPFIRRAIDWVLRRQNADGGWGESAESYKDPSRAGIAPSMPVATTIVLCGLIQAGEGRSEAVARGIAYLLACPRDAQGMWADLGPLHVFYRTDTFYAFIGARYYYPLEALGRYRALLSGQAPRVAIGGVTASSLSRAESVGGAPLAAAPRVSNAMPAKARAKVKEQFDAHQAIRQAMRAPAQLGLSFAAIPQLCLNLDGHLEVVERETLSSLGDWSLLDEPVQLAGFGITETINSFEIDVNGSRVTYRHTDAQQLLLNETVRHTSQQDLIRWLDMEVRQSDIGQAQMQAYLVKMVSHLTTEGGLTLTALVRARFQLAQALVKEVGRLRQIAMNRGFQGRLMDMVVPGLEELAHAPISTSTPVTGSLSTSRHSSRRSSRH